VTVSDKKPTVLKYRLVLYTGKLSEKKINGLVEF
jgi:hypothetical protein